MFSHLASNLNICFNTVIPQYPNNGYLFDNNYFHGRNSNTIVVHDDWTGDMDSLFVKP